MKLTTLDAHTFAYCARHGEYLPKSDANWSADDMDADDDPLDVMRPGWVTKELIAAGFDSDGVDPSGSVFIRLNCDANELFERTIGLYNDLVGGPFGADDDTFDYWPSGVMLLISMIKDICNDQPQKFDECNEMLTHIKNRMFNSSLYNIDQHTIDEVTEKIFG